MSHSLGRDPSTGEVLLNLQPRPLMAIPSVCVVEALITLEGSRKRHRTLIAELQRQKAEARRNKVSLQVHSLVAQLDQSILDLDDIFNESEARLNACVEQIRVSAKLIDLTPEALDEGLNRPLLNDPTDSLILASILEHARSSGATEKVFLSENRRDFDQQALPRTALQAAGIKYVEQASQFLEWWRSRAES